jgi:hypothetical protein
LGPDHEMTLGCESGLEKAESRTIIVTEGLMLIQQYYVCSISEDGYYVVEETKTSRDMRPGGKTVTRIPIDSEYMIMGGTPIVCCGLKNASHLNGKIGDIKYTTWCQTGTKSALKIKA